MQRETVARLEPTGLPQVRQFAAEARMRGNSELIGPMTGKPCSGKVLRQSVRIKSAEPP
jgi:hypothetical protein